MTTEGGNGNVRRAEWTKPRGTVAVVATKTLREVSQQLFVVSSSKFESILV